MFKHLVHTSLFCCCFFFSLYPSLIFSATAINKILTYPEVSVKKQVSWKSSGCTEMIYFSSPVFTKRKQRIGSKLQPILEATDYLYDVLILHVL